jgi:hypothetical protein
LTPFVEVIDTASGQKRQLPNITQHTSASFASVAWKPGTETVAVQAEVGVGPVTAHDWLLDLTYDTAASLPGDQFPVGWAPDTGALVFCNALQADPSETPPTISIMPSPATSAAAPTLLVQAVYSLPFVGFVRTAQRSQEWS